MRASGSLNLEGVIQYRKAVDVVLLLNSFQDFQLVHHTRAMLLSPSQRKDLGSEIFGSISMVQNDERVREKTLDAYSGLGFESETSHVEE